jgi:hypothetical protein
LVCPTEQGVKSSIRQSLDVRTLYQLSRALLIALPYQLPLASASGEDQQKLSGFSQKIWLKPISFLIIYPSAKVGGNSKN